MTNPFKVGDRVVCVDDKDTFLSRGTVYEIIRVSAIGSVQLAGEGLPFFSALRFAHAKPEPLTDTCVMPSAPELTGGARIAKGSEYDRLWRENQALNKLNAELTEKLANAEKWEADTRKALKDADALNGRLMREVEALKKLQSVQATLKFGTVSPERQRAVQLGDYLADYMNKDN